MEGFCLHLLKVSCPMNEESALHDAGCFFFGLVKESSPDFKETKDYGKRAEKTAPREVRQEETAHDNNNNSRRRNPNP